MTTYGPIQLARAADLATWQMDRALELGLVPGPDLAGGRWSDTLAEHVIGQAAAVIAAVGTEAPLGASRLAHRLSAPP